MVPRGSELTLNREWCGVPPVGLWQCGHGYLASAGLALFAVLRMRDGDHHGLEFVHHRIITFPAHGTIRSRTHQADHPVRATHLKRISRRDYGMLSNETSGRTGELFLVKGKGSSVACRFRCHPGNNTAISMRSSAYRDPKGSNMISK
ncbi:hypothetical protein BDV11DRAFT_69269 [Aspergillus similis]